MKDGIIADWHGALFFWDPRRGRHTKVVVHITRASFRFEAFFEVVGWATTTVLPFYYLRRLLAHSIRPRIPRPIGHEAKETYVLHFYSHITDGGRHVESKKLGWWWRKDGKTSEERIRERK